MVDSRGEQPPRPPQFRLVKYYNSLRMIMQKRFDKVRLGYSAFPAHCWSQSLFASSRCSTCLFQKPSPQLGPFALQQRQHSCIKSCLFAASVARARHEGCPSATLESARLYCLEVGHQAGIFVWHAWEAAKEPFTSRRNWRTVESMAKGERLCCGWSRLDSHLAS